MADNLFNLVKGQFSDALMGKAAGLLGESNSATSSAFDSILSTVIGGVIRNGSDEKGAGNLLNVLKDGNHDGGILDNLGDLLGGGTKSDGLMKSGGTLINLLMGNKTGAILDILARVTGLKRNSSSMFMNLLAPVVMGQIGKLVKNKAFDALGLKNFLSGQKSHIERALPNGMTSALGFADKSKAGSTSSTSTSHATTSEKTTSGGGGGGGIFKWLLPLLLIGGLAYFFKDGCASTGTKVADGAKVEKVDGMKKGAIKKADSHKGHDHAGHDHDGHDHAGHDHAGHDHSGDAAGKAGNKMVDAADKVKGGAAGAIGAAGNAVKGAGDKMKEAGGDMAAKFSVDASGNLVDADGKILFKSGEYSEKDGFYVDKDGKRIGKVWGKIKEVVGGAAEKTADFFKNSFGGMFKKDAGAKSSYALNNITWDAESHKIKSFSKAEVEGLASALKSNTDAKIEVQASTKKRAQVVKDMLETLGVGAGQLSASGEDGKPENWVNILVK